MKTRSARKIGAALRQQRLLAGLTQEAAELRINAARGWLNRAENDKRVGRRWLRHYIGLADLYGCSLDTLIGRSE